MISRLLFQIIAGILTIFLAARFVSGVDFSGELRPLIIAGSVLGIVNFAIKPILKAIALPLRIITLGLFTLLLNLFLVWIVVDVLFPGDLEITGFVPLLWTTAILWILNIFFVPYRKENYK
jgi:putative membrane protein